MLVLEVSQNNIGKLSSMLIKRFVYITGTLCVEMRFKSFVNPLVLPTEFKGFKSVVQ